MAQTFFPLVLYCGCIIILNVLDATAQYFPTDANAQSVRIASFGSPYIANSFSSNIQRAIPSSFDTSSNQQLISNNFPSTANAISSSSATASSSLLPPRLIPNAFTSAVLAIPSLQRFLNVRIPRFQGADLLFKVSYKELKALGHPAAATVANVLSQNIASLNVFTIPIYLYIKGKQLEKYLTFKGIAIGNNLIQSYANFTEKSLQSNIINSDEALLQATITGSINFVQSLGYSFLEEAYILALIFSEETVAAIYASKP